jgi:hypothetical protein
MAERKPSDDKAAFGVYPQMKGKRSRQDPEAAKNVPVDVARGFVAGALGMPGDVESLVRLPYEMITGNESPTFLPTSEDIEKRLPFKGDTPVGRAASGLGILGGGFYTGPGSGARAITAVPKAVKRAGLDFAQSISPVNVVKPSGKGANWLDGKRGSIEAQLDRMKMGDTSTPEWYADRARYLEDAKAKGDERAIRAINYDVDVAKRNDAMNAWIQGNLRNYVKNQMATPDDPIRKVAEEGVLHMAPYGEQGVVSSRLMNKRLGMGQDPLGMGRSDPARFWERMSDISVDAYPAGSYKHGSLDESLLADNPWLQKVPDDTMIYSGKGISGDLGFDHILDVLREDLTAGRIRPEQLNKVSMEQAVRRTHEYDQELAAKMNAARAAQREGLPVYKEYPEGYRWVELNKPGAFASESEAMGHSVRGYEPPQGHPDWMEGSGGAGSLGYGHGGWEAIKSGKAKVYSLVDPKGEPHVTVEVAATGMTPEQRQYKIGFLADQLQKEGKTAEEALRQAEKIYPEEHKEAITQIKGKQNRAPNQEYLPFVQDLVKSGQWFGVDDIQNTGLVDINKSAIRWPEGTQAEQIDRLVGGMEGGTSTPLYKSSFDLTNKAEQELGSKYVTEKEYKDWLSKQINPDAPPPEGMKRGGVVISNNPDTMMLEVNNAKMAGGGLLKGLKAAAKATKETKAPKGTQEVLPAAEREENLQKFLGNSRIRERLYHATPKNFKHFKPGGDDPTLSGPAIWLTPDATKQPAAHNIGGGSRGFVEGTNVMPVYAQARSPLMLDDRLSIEWAREVFADGSREFPDLISQKTIDELKSSGYDSIIHADPYGNRDGEQEILMFEPNRIKSAIGNRGTYDIEDPDITKAEGGAIHMKGGGAEDDTKPYFGGAGTKKYAAAKKRAEQADVNLLPDPKTYAAVSGLLGTAPDEMGFSVLRPDYQAIRDVAEPAFYTGTALGIAPLAKALNAPLAAAGKALEPAAGRFVTKTMERGGLGADILRDMGQGARSYAYLPHTPGKPDPTVGSRYKTQSVGNLAPKRDFDIQAEKGSSVMSNPWDSTSRGEKVLEVSDTPLVNPFVTEGGQDFARDLVNIESGVGGASGRQIAERMQDRVNDAYFANMLDKGTGRIFTMPSTMEVTGSNYSTMPTDIIMDFFKQAELPPKYVDRVTDDLRSFVFEEERGKFKNAAKVGSPEFMKQLREGGEGFSAGDLRKGLMNRMSKAEYQKLLGYNIEDVYGAIHDPTLKDLPKGFVGNTMIETSPFASVGPSTHQSYNASNAGKYAGSMPSMPIELMMPDLYQAMEINYLKSPKYQSLSPSQLRTMIINTIEKRGSVISQPINDRVIDNAMRYQEGLKQGHFNPKDYDSIMEFMRRTGGYKKGGAVTVKPEVKKAGGGAIDYNTTPDMSDGGRIMESEPFKQGGKVKMTANRDAMFLELSNKKLKRK